MDTQQVNESNLREIKANVEPSSKKDAVALEDLDTLNELPSSSISEGDDPRSKDLSTENTVNSKSQDKTSENTNSASTVSFGEINEQQGSGSENNNISITRSHPYGEIFLNFQPTEEQLSINNIEPYKSLQQTPLREVTTKEELEKLVKDLKQEKELGVDSEYSDHGYKALTCLLQISTTKIDYIIDAIKLKDHMHLLNEILTDPAIVKIFHAGQNDLKWLQQDFRLFVVNMFDTQKAMKALNYEKLGLDSLLNNYNITKDKAMQRVDFRQRPLPAKYKEYARTDSHFLIHIYHTLKNKLVEADLLHQVLEECKKDCLVVYEEQGDSSYQSVRDEIVSMHQRQLVALEKLNQWRHRIAKDLNKNTGHILSKNDMKQLILRLPVDAATIINIGKSQYVKRDIQEIVEIMMEANCDKSRSSTVGTSKFGNKRKGNSYNQRGSHNKRRRNFSDYGGYDRGNAAHFEKHRGKNRRFY